MRTRTARRWIVAACTAALVAACDDVHVDQPPRADAEATKIASVQTATEGWLLRPLAVGLDGPTQVARLDQRRLLVAQLSGGENDETGSVVVVDRETGAVSAPILTGLDKPTGVAVNGAHVLVMERRRLVAAPLSITGQGIDDVDAGDLDVVADDLPFNGRSSSALTATPFGSVLFATTGRRIGTTPESGSGLLYEVDLDATGVPVQIASNFKNAYDHDVLFDGRLVIAEVGDGRIDGVSVPDAVYVIDRRERGNWPDCIAEPCPDVAAPLVTLPDGATPTGIAVVKDVPGAETIVVTSFVAGTISAFDLDGSAVTPPISGPFDGPNDLLAVDDALYLTEFGTGILWVAERI